MSVVARPKRSHVLTVQLTSAHGERMAANRIFYIDWQVVYVQADFPLSDSLTIAIDAIDTGTCKPNSLNPQAGRCVRIAPIGVAYC